MPVLWLTALVVVFATAGPSQQRTEARKAETQPEIRGVVLEAGLSRPVSDAEVSYWKVPGGSYAPALEFTPGKALGRAKTGADGAFRFSPEELGNYYVRVTREGYVNAGRMSTSATVGLTESRPTREIEFTLARPARITGQLMDEETGQPIQGRVVDVGQDYYTRGRRLPMGGGRAVTDRSGRFSSEVTPGDYLVRIGPGSGRLMEKFSEDDLGLTDLDYPESFWSGGLDEDSAPAVPVPSGGWLELGLLQVKKKPFYRAHISLLGAVCEQGDRVSVTVTRVPPKWWQGVGVVPCSSEILIRGFAPGSYRVGVWIVGQPGTKGRAVLGVADLQVVDRNVDAPVLMTDGVRVAGRILASEGALKPPLEKIRVSLLPEFRPTAGAIDSVASPDATGHFALENMPVAEHRLRISGIPAGFYVKEVRYNGLALRGNPSEQTLELDRSAPDHALEIEVDDKPAFLSGTVADRGHPVNRPYVVLSRWPLSVPSALWPVPSATGDEDGKFQVAGLAPGEYRVLAVSSACSAELEKPNLLERLLARARKVELGPRGSVQVSLELTELR